jgi:hypothetical protein
MTSLSEIRSRRARAQAVAVLVVAVAFGFLAAPAPVRAECPSGDESYTGPCGPTFTTSMWGDAAGWTDPSKYSTIQLGDVNGDGKDELLGRGDSGIEIWTFDTSLGQWRPQVDAQDVRQVLSDFRSPGLGEDTLGWKDPSYYTTIQTANVDGTPGVEVLARFPDGMRAYGYRPPPGGNDIDGGTWELLAAQGPYTDAGNWRDPQYYSTVRAVEAQGRSYAISHDGTGLLSASWPGAGWTYESHTSELAGCSQPNCYHSVRVLPGGGRFSAAEPNSSFGQSVKSFQGPGRGWSRLPVDGGSFPSGPLSNTPGPDCPLDISGDCFPKFWALWETTRWANLAPQSAGLPQLVALAPQGLLVYNPVPGRSSGSIAWQPLHNLDDLTYPLTEWAEDPGKPASLTIANLDGQGGGEVLALQDGQLKAWSYNAAADAWTQLQPTTPLALSDTAVWNQDESHYGTFRAGDVDGDGREEILARGPFGIRTWFYDRRGSGGWERYLPGGYPDFPGGQSGQSAAFSMLNQLARQYGYITRSENSVRDVWSAENPPDDLTRLESGVETTIGDCSNPLPGEQPRYETCNPPAGATFGVADWTAVINEVLAEIFAADQVLAHFDDLDKMRASLFLVQKAELPAIGSDLGLQAAANQSAAFDQGDFWASFVQIIGSIAGLAVPEAGAALSIGGDIISMVSSATPSTTSTFDTDYAGIQGQFADSVDEALKQSAALSQTVRQDLGLLTLVARLRQRGTWQPDLIGVRSAADQAFVAWVYQSLLPSMYDRYQVTNCGVGGETCIPPSSSASYPGVVGTANGPSFTALSAPFQGSVPCVSSPTPPVTCKYDTLPSDLANRVFGPTSPGCDYVPGNAATAWTFGCNLGLSAQTTVGPLGEANGWDFTTHSADPWCCQITASAVTRSHAVGEKAAVRLTEVLRVPPGFRFSQASAVATRVRHEVSGRKELTAPGPFLARPADRSRGRRKARRPRARVRLRRLGPTRLAVKIRMRRRGLRVPRACHALPPSLQPRGAVFQLETRVRLRDGRTRTTRVIRRHWRCERDRYGNVVRLRVVRRRPSHRLRRGLQSRLELPASVRPGTTARARVKVRNARRRGPSATLWHVTVAGSYTTSRRARRIIGKRIRRLGAGHSRTVRLRLRVPRSARGRLCVHTTTTADLARHSTRRRCIPIR